MKEHTKAVMHSAAAQHPLTAARLPQRYGQAQALSSSFSPVLHPWGQMCEKEGNVIESGALRK